MNIHPTRTIQILVSIGSRLKEEWQSGGIFDLTPKPSSFVLADALRSDVQLGVNVHRKIRVVRHVLLCGYRLDREGPRIVAFRLLLIAIGAAIAVTTNLLMKPLYAGRRYTSGCLETLKR